MRKRLFLFLVIHFLYVIPFHESPCHQQVIVIIDPAGDVKRPGRQIGDSFERGLTLQCAEKIKEMVELKAPHINVIITRMPGDSVYDLQNASLSNRLNADLFINLNFYYCQETKPTLFLYQFSYGNDFVQLPQELICNTYDQAYRINKIKTDEIVTQFKQILSGQKYQPLFMVPGLYQIPLKPLIGVIAPSISIEVGLKNKDMWLSYCKPIAQSIITVMDSRI